MCPRQEGGFVMTTRILTLESLKNVSLEDLMARVLREQQTLTIQVSNEQEIVITPQKKLKPLPVLEGYIPEGWREAIYDLG